MCHHLPSSFFLKYHASSVAIPLSLQTIQRKLRPPPLKHMATPHCFFILSLSLLLLFHGSFSLRQPRDECQVDRINALEPDNRVECEAGVIDSWNPNEDQFQCAGVAVVRWTIEPRGLLLPSYSNAPQLVYIVRG